MNTVCQEQLNDVILNNKNLIYDLANKYNSKNNYSLREDLFQVGAMGMINAFNNYDPNRNTKFTSYAYPYIVGEMKKFLREDRVIKVSRDVIYLCSQIERAKDLLRQKLKKEPSLSELSSAIGIEEDKIIEAMEMNNSIKSIDEPINDEGRELTIKDVVYKKEHYDKLDLICLREELSKLLPKDKEILTKRFFEEMTQCETATMLGISQVDVSRCESKLILLLRNRLK